MSQGRTSPLGTSTGRTSPHGTGTGRTSPDVGTNSRSRHDSGGSGRLRHCSGNLRSVQEDSVFLEDEELPDQPQDDVEVVTIRTRRWTISIPNRPLGRQSLSLFTGYGYVSLVVYSLVKLVS